MTTEAVRLSIFDDLEETNLELAANAVRGTRRVAPGGTVYSRSTNGDQIVVVIDGWATAHQHGISIGSVGCGEIVGNLSTLGLDHQPLTVTARTNVVVMDFDEKDFCDLVLHSSVLSLALARMYARKLRVIRNDLYPPTQIW